MKQAEKENRSIPKIQKRKKGVVNRSVQQHPSPYIRLRILHIPHRFLILFP